MLGIILINLNTCQNHTNLTYKIKCGTSVYRGRSSNIWAGGEQTHFKKSSSAWPPTQWDALSLQKIRGMCLCLCIKYKKNFQDQAIYFGNSFCLDLHKVVDGIKLDTYTKSFMQDFDFKTIIVVGNGKEYCMMFSWYLVYQLGFQNVKKIGKKGIFRESYRCTPFKTTRLWGKQVMTIGSLHLGLATIR